MSPAKKPLNMAPPAVILIRLLVGWVFVSEGVQKFLYPDALGVGRFIRIGIPSPHVMGPFVGGVEIAFGLLLVIGLLTRLSVIPLLIDIIIAIISTKGPILLGHGYWGFHVRKLDHYGPWAMLHESRTDFSMFLGLLFLLIVGGGAWSVDASFMRRRGGLFPRPIHEPIDEKEP